MAEVHDVVEPVGGRVARRRRNIDSIFGVVMEMFARGRDVPDDRADLDQVGPVAALAVSLLRRPAEPIQATINRMQLIGRDLSAAVDRP